MLYLFNDKGKHIYTFWYDSTNEHGRRYFYFGLFPSLRHGYETEEWSWWTIDDFDDWLSNYLANYDGWDGKPPYTVYFQD